MTLWGEWILLLHRLSNYCYKIYNRLKFKFYGVTFGKGLCIHGHVGLLMKKNGKLIIGNNFYYSSGRHINPLCGNIQGHLCVERNAMLLIGNNVAMSSPHIWANSSITIGNHVLLGGNVTIVDSDMHSLNYIVRRIPSSDHQNKKCKSIIIEDDVFIGMNTIVLKGVTIGARSVIGAGSVVTQSIPADCIAAGNPAKIIKSIKQKG